jgi:hypothetical protein
LQEHRCRKNAVHEGNKILGVDHQAAAGKDRLNHRGVTGANRSNGHGEPDIAPDKRDLRRFARRSRLWPFMFVGGARMETARWLKRST